MGREKERVQREKEERKAKEEEEERKKIEEEEKKKQAIANMSMHYGGYLARGDRNKNNKRITEREKKRKLLAERRKPLNIDHLGRDKLVEKVGDLQAQLDGLEHERFDFEMAAESQKYMINQQRVRIQLLQSKSGLGKNGS